MIDTVRGRMYWLNEQTKLGERFINPAQLPGLVTSAAVVIILGWRTNLPWWVLLGSFIATTAIIVSVTKFISRRFRKFDKLEREGVIAAWDSMAFTQLRERLSAHNVTLDRLKKYRDRLTVYPLVTAYLRRVYVSVDCLEKGGLSDDTAEEHRRTIAACASQVAEHIAETLEKLAAGDRLVSSYDDAVQRLRDRLAQDSASDELRGTLAADVERELG